MRVSSWRAPRFLACIATMNEFNMKMVAMDVSPWVTGISRRAIERQSHPCSHDHGYNKETSRGRGRNAPVYGEPPRVLACIETMNGPVPRSATFRSLQADRRRAASDLQPPFLRAGLAVKAFTLAPWFTLKRRERRAPETCSWRVTTLFCLHCNHELVPRKMTPVIGRRVAPRAPHTVGRKALSGARGATRPTILLFMESQ